MDTHDVPDDVRREVGEAANHACARCGTPLFGYYRLDGEGETDPDSTDPDRLVALCPACRADAVAGSVGGDELRSYRADPAVGSPGEHPFHFEGTPRLLLGNVAVTLPEAVPEPAPVIRLDAQQLLGVSVVDGRVGLDVDFYDDARPVGSFADGEWWADDAETWSVSFSAEDRTLKLFDEAENVGVAVRAFADPPVLLVTGSLSYHGKRVHVRRESGVTVPTSGTQFSDYDFRLSEDGAAVLSLS
jgi:hypothetical protein